MAVPAPVRSGPLTNTPINKSLHLNDDDSETEVEPDLDDSETCASSEDESTGAKWIKNALAKPRSSKPKPSGQGLKKRSTAMMGRKPIPKWEESSAEEDNVKV